MSTILRRLARRAGAIIAECNDAQRRLAAVREDPEHYVLEPDTAPETYQHFLIRAARPVAHEPSAATRARGLEVRLAAVPKGRA
jgi:hypothetical protein